MQKRQEVLKQDPKKRIHNFDEVALGLTEEQAVLEANRCIDCKNAPCIKGCPVEIDIPEFIKAIAQKDFKTAVKVLKERNNLPAICGRVCPQEAQCETPCTLGKKGEPVNIGKLERFVADWEISNSKKFKASRQSGIPLGAGKSTKLKRNNIKVAVVGSGPAGLTAAADLAKMGYLVTIFESLHASGGVLRYGIPEFRLPKRIVDIETDYILSLGVDLKVNVLVGRTITFADLFSRSSGIPPEAGKENFKAIFVGTGAGLPVFLHIPGENLNGIYSANEFLTRVNLMNAYKFPECDTPIKIGKRVAVIGAGNTAMDSVRVARRLGADEAMIVYRRSEKEMPARIEEIENAREEGIIFKLLTAPVKFIGDSLGWVKKMECIKMELGQPDESGRRRPVPQKHSEYLVDVDSVIIAIGQNPNPLLPKAVKDLKTTKESNVIVDENFMTSIEGVFAGGDIVTGEGTVIAAMGQAKQAARAIDDWIKTKL